MSGLDIVGGLLRADSNTRAMFPADDQIKGGRLAEGEPLPALLIKETSTVERQTLKREATTRTVDRVSVTVRAASHREQRVAMRLVTACCAGRTGNIAGHLNVSVATAGKGPELDGPDKSFERTADFRVSYDATN